MNAKLEADIVHFVKTIAAMPDGAIHYEKYGTRFVCEAPAAARILIERLENERPD